METQRTIKDLAAEALQVQDAVNPSGVARSMHEALIALRDNGVTSTADLCRHPVTVMFALKLADMVGLNVAPDSVVDHAFLGCKRLSEQ